MYSLRDFYTEEGKSLVMTYDHYWSSIARFRKDKVVEKSMYNLYKKLYRVNGWHKMHILHKRLNKSYCLTDISMAKINY